MVPFKLKPAFKDYIWGGSRLKTEFGKQSDLDIVAESWELSCHRDGENIIQNGEFAGMTLTELVEQDQNGLLGSNCDQFTYFPILIKLIDARDDLSIQVHPDNDYALRVEGEYGKTEMWYVVDCEENATLYYGFKQEISKEEFRRRIEQGTLLEVLNEVPVSKGSVFFIEAGTIHAIKGGILIAEIQQNSNTTYRVYDYGRTDAQGNQRELHVDKAIDVTTLRKPAREPKPQGETIHGAGFDSTLLASCTYFTVSVLQVCDRVELEADGTSFHSLLVLDGEGSLTWDGGSLSCRKGDSLFIPAGFGKYAVQGTLQAIFTRI